MELSDLCMGCMTEKQSGQEGCPLCGFVEGTVPDSPLFLPPGTILQEKYLIGKVLGQGGFGITYLAWDINLNLKLAIKEYFPQELAIRAAGHSQVSAYSGGQGNQYVYGLDKFLQEARTLAQFEGHPNIVSVRDFFKANGTAYFVMSYVEGITLQKYLADVGGKLPVNQAFGIIMPVLDALKEVHSVKVLHRDISPDNIFINRKGQIILLDFGAARQAIGEKGRSLSIILKPGYAPEEQYRTKGEQGPWTDIYAVAATIYHLVTAKQPPEALERLVDDTLVRPTELGAELGEKEENALLKALAVRAPERYQTIEEFQSDLLGEKVAAAAIPPTPAPSARSVKIKEDQKSASKKKISPALVISAFAVLVLSIGAFALWSAGLIPGSTSSETDQSVILISEEENTITKDEEVPLPGHRGNTSGNIINGGLAAIQGDKIYFRSNEGGSLYKGNLTEGTASILSADAAWFINVAGEWVYYSNRDDYNRIYKIKTDGSGRTPIIEEGAWYLTLVDGWLYYLDQDDEYRIYKINIDGNNRVALGDTSAWFLQVDESWVYYVNLDDEGKIYKVSINGGDSEKINDDSSAFINLSDQWIYYVNESDGSKIYRMKKDGSEIEALNDLPSWFLNYDGEWLYYANESDNFSLNRIKPDGTDRVKLTNEPVRYITVTSDWIYYLDHSMDDVMFKINKEGTEREKVEGEF